MSARLLLSVVEKASRLQLAIRLDFPWGYKLNAAPLCQWLISACQKLYPMHDQKGHGRKRTPRELDLIRGEQDGRTVGGCSLHLDVQYIFAAFA